MISVVIPVLNESQTVQAVVQFALRHPKVSEVIVVDDGWSIDGTPEAASQAGAKVLSSTFLGKGASMEDGMWAARNDVLLYLDGDLAGLHEDLIDRMEIAPEQVLAVGDGKNDICMLRAAGISVAFHPMTPRVGEAARYTASGSLADVLTLVEQHNWGEAPVARLPS